MMLQVLDYIMDDQGRLDNVKDITKSFSQERLQKFVAELHPSSDSFIQISEEDVCLLRNNHE